MVKEYYIIIKRIIIIEIDMKENGKMAWGKEKEYYIGTVAINTKND